MFKDENGVYEEDKQEGAAGGNTICPMEYLPSIHGLWNLLSDDLDINHDRGHSVYCQLL